MEETFVKALDLVQEILELQEALGDAMRDGFLSLSTARRWAAGRAPQVSPLSAPSRMRASRGVRARPGGAGMQLVAIEGAAPLARGGGAPAAGAGSPPPAGGLLAELSARFDARGAAPMEASSSSSDGEGGGAAGDDPLRWFGGGLAPPALREGQRHFVRAAGAAVRLAERRAALAALLDRWRALGRDLRRLRDLSL